MSLLKPVRTDHSIGGISCLCVKCILLAVQVFQTIRESLDQVKLHFTLARDCFDAGKISRLFNPPQTIQAAEEAT
jgi:hypothetical protein